jgi:hypothetical protein
VDQRGIETIMSSLTESLRRFVQSGTVDVREAYRKADDRAAFLAAVKQDGIDTLFVERFASSPKPGFHLIHQQLDDVVFADLTDR